MKPFWRRDDWKEDAPIARRMSFSSFSRSIDDIWGRNLKRPYWIVLLPGYTPPAALDRGCKDAMWIDGQIDKPLVVWDGYSKIALFEMIRECFDPKGSSPYIKVVDAENRKKICDNRDPEIMALRPEREKGWGPRKIHNHIVELSYWAGMFPGADETSSIYAEMLVAHGNELTTTRDSYKRSEEFMKAGLHNECLRTLHQEIMDQYDSGKIKLRTLCQTGPRPGLDPARAVADREVALLSTTASDTVDHAILDVADFRETGRPRSFYRTAAKKGRRIRDENRTEAARSNRRPAQQPEGRTSGRASGLTSEDVPLGEMSGFDKNPF